MEVGATSQVLDALVGLAELLAPVVRPPRMLRALRLISTHPAAERSTRERVTRLLPSDEVSGSAPPPGAPAPELSTLVADVLA